MNKNKPALFRAAGLLFFIAGAIGLLNHPPDYSMFAVWTSIAVVFYVLGSRVKN